MIYRTYSKYLKDKYKDKVYKLPINIPTTCPNRDGCVGVGGCIFCGSDGAGHENLSNTISVQEQIAKNMEYISKRYKANKFIAYFQNFTNTYLEFNKFSEYIKGALQDNVVEIAISTRPDCINDKILDFLEEIKIENKVEITIELGLQTVNYKTLEKINRGHGLAEFIDSVVRIKKHGFTICAHVILDLPWDDMDDCIENAKVLSALDIDFVKLHSLYVVEETKLAQMYLSKEVNMLSKEEYEQRVITFLRYIKPNVVIQRLIGRAPKEGTISVNWDTSWWKIKDEILEAMQRDNYKQGDCCDYLNGKAINRFY